MKQEFKLSNITKRTIIDCKTPEERDKVIEVMEREGVKEFAPEDTRRDEFYAFPCVLYDYGDKEFDVCFRPNETLNEFDIIIPASDFIAANTTLFEELISVIDKTTAKEDKEQTIEEAARTCAKGGGPFSTHYQNYEYMFIAGANWHKQQGYIFNEEDIINLLESMARSNNHGYRSFGVSPGNTNEHHWFNNKHWAASNEVLKSFIDSYKTKKS